MPQAKTDDSFSYFQLGLALGMDRMYVQQLARAGVLPGDQGIRDVKRLSAIGAFVSAGTPLLAASLLCRALATELFDEPDGEVPTGLKVEIGRLRSAPSASGQTISVSLPAGDYWYHKALWLMGKADRLNSRWDEDVIFVVAEHRFVWRLLAVGHSVDETNGCFVGELEGARGRDNPAPRLIVDPEFKMSSIERVQPLPDYVGKLTVNLSLAARRGLSRITEDRVSRGRERDRDTSGRQWPS